MSEAAMLATLALSIGLLRKPLRDSWDIWTLRRDIDRAAREQAEALAEHWRKRFEQARSRDRGPFR